MAKGQYDRQTQKHSHRWLGVLAFLVILVCGGGMLLLARVESVAVQSVHGAAMAPLLRSGDAVVLAKTQAVEAGDIISYRSPINPADILTRRVFAVDTTKDIVITKGDNTAKADAPFSRTLVIGVARYQVPKLGYGLDFLCSPAGLITGIYLPAAVIVGLELRRLSSYYEQPIYRVPGYRVRLS